MTTLQNTDTSVTARIPVALANLIDAAAHAQGVTRSELIRNVLDIAFGRRSSAPPPPAPTRRPSEPMLRVRIPARLAPTPKPGETKTAALARALGGHT